MSKKPALKAALAVALLFRLLLSLPLVSSELNVTCEDYEFTGQKLDDCNYILGSDISDQDKLDLLDVLQQEEYIFQINPPQFDNNIFLQITSDKSGYKPGEEIKITILPPNTPVSISYGDVTKIAQDKTSFIAKDGVTSITADYQNKHYTLLIYVREKSPLILFWNLVILCFLNYALFSYLNYLSEKRKWHNADS